MRRLIKRFYISINLWRIIPAYLVLYTLKKDLQQLILDEMYHWKKCTGAYEKRIFLFGELLLEYKEYRNLICYRIKSGGGY